MHGHDGATLMSIRDAALATGLSPKALRRRIERGTLASVMVDGRRRIPRDDLILRGLLESRKTARRGSGNGNGGRDLSPGVLEDRLRGLEARVQFLEAAVRSAGLSTSFLRQGEHAGAVAENDGDGSAGPARDGRDALGVGPRNT